MMLNTISLATVLACIGTALADDGNFTLHAYGEGITAGLKFFYGDGQAYVGLSSPSFVSTAVNITLLPSPEDETKFVATLEGTEEWSSKPTLYIDPTAGAINPVGFVLANESLPEGATDTGFGLYGGWAFHKSDSEAAFQMNFVATPTNETDVFLVKWNAGGATAVDDVPITLRTQAPVVITD